MNAASRSTREAGASGARKTYWPGEFDGASAVTVIDSATEPILIIIVTPEATPLLTSTLLRCVEKPGRIASRRQRPGATPRNAYAPFASLTVVRLPREVCSTSVTPGSGLPPGSTTTPRTAPSEPAYGVSTICGEFEDDVQPRMTRARVRMTRFISPPSASRTSVQA